MTIFNTDISVFYSENLVPFNNFCKQKGRKGNFVFNLRIKLQKKKRTEQTQLEIELAKTKISITFSKSVHLTP